MSTRYDNRNRRWRFEFNQVINGQRIRQSKLLPAAWDRNQAKKFDQAETARLYGIATGVIKQRFLIQDAIDAYGDFKAPQLKRGMETMKELALLYPYYEGRYLDELAEVAQEYADAERERLKPGSIRNRLAYLRAACKYAQKYRGIGDPEAKYDITTPIVKNAREVFATRADMLKIARHCEDRQARALIRIAFYSGMRLGEMMLIGRSNEIIENGFLLKDTKNGETRIAPMHPRIRSACNYLPITWSRIWIQRLIRDAMNAAGFRHLRLHDLRHSTASAMINNNVDLYTVGAVLGHKDHRSTARYAHLARDTLDKAIRKIR